MNAKILLISLTCVVLSGCASTLNDVFQISTTPVQKTNLDLHSPSPVVAKPVKWVVITPENADKVFEELRKSKASLALFAVTDDYYKNLSLNFSEMRSFIIQQQKVLDEYRKYYESEKEVPSAEK